jgi:hypothetical protein
MKNKKLAEKNNNIKQTRIKLKPESPITDLDLPKIREIISGLKADQNAFFFLNPVNYKELGLDDYILIIKTPMDLSTVQSKLTNNQYITIDQIFTDIQLIWDNCKRYNIEGSAIYKQAQNMEKSCEKLIKRYYIYKSKP